MTGIKSVSCLRAIPRSRILNRPSPSTLLRNIHHEASFTHSFHSAPSRHRFRYAAPQNTSLSNDYPSSLAFLAMCAGSCLFVSYSLFKTSFSRQPLRLDASAPRDPLTSAVKVEITGQDHDDAVDRVSTGTSKVPYFPRAIWLPRSGGSKIESRSAALPAGVGPAREEEEYHLLGLGVRTVSFLSIQVYVVGIYIAKGDLGRFQEDLIRLSVPEGSTASTLVQNEKEDLRKRLLDGSDSEQLWGKILQNGGIRSAIRIVPVRDTNFNHLRDGWLRGIDMRGKGPEFEDQNFKASVADFKNIMGGRGSVGKGRVMLLGRGTGGDLRAWVEEDAATAGQAEQNLQILKGDRMSLLGRVDDERLSRLVWLGYLAGSKVASEAARESVIEGVMDVVARPSGTIETQVL